MRSIRQATTCLTGLLLAAGALSVTTVPANAAVADVKINEVESNGDPVGDFTELVNTGTSDVDVSGLTFRDSDTSHAFYAIPDGTTIPAGGYYVITEAQQGFGLGEVDSVTLYRADTTTVVDSYSWSTHAATTYARCPDGAGALTTSTASTRGAVNACPVPSSAVRLNEIESDDGTPGDWVELYNTGTTAVDVSGYVLKDSADTAGYPIPGGTTLGAGGYLVLDVAQFGFGLGGADAARLFLPGASTPYDTYTWAAHAATTYGRCPGGTGAFVTTTSPTKGSANACPGDPVTGPWPGAASVATVDSPALAAQVTSNLSGLVYEGTGTSTPGTLWSVLNGPGTLFKLEESGGTWGQAPGDFAAGKVLRFTDGTGDVDAEGITLTDAGSAGGVFVSTERNNADNTVSRPAILRYDPNAAGTTLSANRDWNLTADLPTLGANLGLEGIAWVPDTYLTASGFRDQVTGAAYSPATYPDHGTGLFLVGVEGNGMVYAYALDQTSNSYTRVASFASGFPSVMELDWEAETQQLWVLCDDTCQGRSSRFAVNAAGLFAPTPYYERPAGMPNLNNEGFATTPRAECVDGLKPVFWSDDNDTGALSLREGSLSCTPLPGASPAAPTGALPATASAARDTTGPVLRITRARGGKVYRGQAPRPRCSATDASGVTSCTLTRKRKSLGAGRRLVTVKAAAVDGAGNTSRVRESYVVVR